MPRDRRGWTAWSASFSMVVAAGLFAAATLGTLSSEALRSALDEALADHLGAEAGVVAAALKSAPVEAIAALGGNRSTAELRERLAALATAGSLHDVALLAPARGFELTTEAGRSWLPGPADRDLIAEAVDGPRLGPLYRAQDGALYRAAYAPLPDHAGFVVAVEGSGATLGAVDRLETLLIAVGAVVVAGTAGVGALFAVALVRPLGRLDRELSAAVPGVPAHVIGIQGPREVRDVARAARRLLDAIRDRDRALAVSHAERIAEITQMAAGVAHEVRNPLHALTLTLETLETCDDPARRSVLTNRARGCASEIEGMVVRFLELSRPIEPRLRTVAADEVARDVLEGLEGSLAFRIVAEPGELSTDPDLMRQVLRNLVLNAAQAGAARVEVRVTVGERVRIEVEDDGPGVPPDDADAIFGWFHTTRTTGQGIGLPLSRRICQALGGDLALLRARPATFRIELPGGTP